jgi:hypothetical protein
MAKGHRLGATARSDKKDTDLVACGIGQDLADPPRSLGGLSDTITFFEHHILLLHATRPAM